eukprot:13731850-Heterocapsa_arctica.AAC.1
MASPLETRLGVSDTHWFPGEHPARCSLPRVLLGWHLPCYVLPLAIVLTAPCGFQKQSNCGTHRGPCPGHHMMSSRGAASRQGMPTHASPRKHRREPSAVRSLLPPVPASQ